MKHVVAKSTRQIFPAHTILGVQRKIRICGPNPLQRVQPKYLFNLQAEVLYQIFTSGKARIASIKWLQK